LEIDYPDRDAALAAYAEAMEIRFERARDAVLKDDQLESGVIREITKRKRDRAWECVGLFALLDQFERTLATPAGQRVARRARRSGGGLLPASAFVRGRLSDARFVKGYSVDGPNARPSAVRGWPH